MVEAHKDFAWISKNITYGLYLSDHSILNAIDTEVVVLSGIVVQNLKRESAWHLRGLRRVGVSMEDTEKIHQCVSRCPPGESLEAFLSDHGLMSVAYRSRWLQDLQESKSIKYPE
ncbi:MAG: hypothetical protein Q9163_004493 [Psora crenata]